MKVNPCPDCPLPELGPETRKNPTEKAALEMSGLSGLSGKADKADKADTDPDIPDSKVTESVDQEKYDPDKADMFTRTREGEKLTWI